ncbi:YycH family regulatory protein [Radiobacillus sp. PE A8.2]|uniref:YycH family regulatory protein n=1 Tax=Radiobacillus sp. PE A8.2 TaxID=3380349 RepID=UPI00388F3F24
MKIETLKSIVLVFLITLSLTLTLGIWNYQPNASLEDSDDNTIEAKIGGIQETKKSIIEPSQMIYHINGNHQGLKDNQIEDSLYKELQSSSIYDFRSMNEVDKIGPEQSNQYVEIVFPTALPTDVIQDIFSTNEDITIPGKQFDRMYIILDEDQSEEQIQFVNTQSQSNIIANIQNFPEERDQIIKYYNSNNQLIDYLAFNGFNDIPIYVPRESITLERHPFQAKQIATNPLRNELFTNPSAVRSNNEDIFGPGELLTDGQRKMFVSKNYYMEFTDPIQTEGERVTGRDLITNTLAFINNHDGWTTEKEDEYILYDLNLLTNTVRYRLVYGGYPVLENDQLSTITVSMSSQNVSQYYRPLIQLQGPPLYGQQVTMPSGEQVINEINRNRQFSSQVIRDIKIGYRIEEQQGAQYVFTLIPAWFVKDGLGWSELTFEEIPVEGGEGNAVGAD